MKFDVDQRLFEWLDVDPHPIWADVVRLQEKHPEYFSSPEDVRRHIRSVLSRPDMAMPASHDAYTLMIAVQSEGNHKAAVVEFKLRGGKYRVRNAQEISQAQVEAKATRAGGKMKLRRGGQGPTVPARNAPRQSLTRNPVPPSDGHPTKLERSIAHDRVLFLKAKRPGTADRMIDMFGPSPALIEKPVEHAGYTDTHGVYHKPHTQRHKVRADEAKPKPAAKEPAAAEPFDDMNPQSPNYRYRDTGYVAGSRKEDAANLLRVAKRTGAQVRKNDVDWEAIEGNPREAKEVITKSHLFGSVDWDALKAGGMEPGAGSWSIGSMHRSVRVRETIRRNRARITRSDLRRFAIGWSRARRRSSWYPFSARFATSSSGKT